MFAAGITASPEFERISRPFSTFVPSRRTTTGTFRPSSRAAAMDLRQVPADPLTGRAEWGLQRSPDGQILGVYSLAPGVPIKRTGFEPELGALADAPSYQAWVFGARVLIPAPARSGPSGR